MGKTYGSTASEGASSILVTEDGNYVFAGTSGNDNGDVSENFGYDDFWIVKIDTEGNILWEKSFGDYESEYCYSIIRTSDGGYLANGRQYYEFDVDLDLYNYSVKITSEGELEWEDGLWGERYINNIFETEGEYLSVGYRWLEDALESDVMITKLNEDGNPMFYQYYGGSESDYLLSEIIQFGTQFIAAGYTYSDDGDITINKGQNDFLLISFDDSGNLNWQKTLGGSNYEYGTTLIKTNYNEIVIDGRSKSSDFDVTAVYAEYNIWLVKLDMCYTQYFADADGDGFGSNVVYSFSCVPVEGYLLTSGDCDDNNNLIHPGIVLDPCNGIDDNCNGEIDEDAFFTMYFEDADGDGYGNILINTFSCEPVAGYVSDSTDCDDNNNLIHPGALDLCNGIDENCNGELDEDAEFFTYYFDEDGDGFGNDIIDTISCSDVSGYSLESGDCDDANNTFNPDAFDDCDGFDQNCNGLIDEDATYVLFYADTDGDGFGNVDSHVLYCATPDGYVTDSTDCDDTNENIYPGATEILNGVDDNCDGVIDEGLSVNTLAQNTIKLFPNPANTEIHIEHALHIISIITRNNLGETLTVEFINDVADISPIPPGVYFSEIQAEEGIVVVSWVKE
ncbi:MAG: MopE-related protein [Chitinophagales bacterium]